MISDNKSYRQQQLSRQVVPILWGAWRVLAATTAPGHPSVRVVLGKFNRAVYNWATKVQETIQNQIEITGISLQ